MRIAIIAIAPAPYREPLFRQLAQSPQLELKVFYLQPRDSLRGWTNTGFPYAAEFVPCWTPERFYAAPLLGAVNPSLASRLAAFRPDALVIYGHSFAAQYAAMLWARRRGVPYFLRCDSNPNNLVWRRDGRAARWVRLRRWAIRHFAARAAGVLSIGEANDRYWALFGVPEEKRFLARFAVDNEWFAAESERWRPLRQQERERLGIETSRVLLYLGRLAAPKNLENLLRAWKQCDHLDQTLLVAGGGPLEGALRSLARREGIRRMVFAPFTPNREVPRYYALSDALILPSSFEPWGLVVNEAMACGLPVLVSQRCGCVPDLVRDGVNGFRLDPSGPEPVAAALHRFAALSAAETAAFGEASRRLIADWNYQHAIDGFLRALHSVSPA